MKKLLTLLLMTIMMFTLVSCGGGDGGDAVDESVPLGLSLLDDNSMNITFSAEPYAELMAAKEALSAESEWSLSIAACFYDDDDNDLGTFYYDMSSEGDDASYSVDYMEFYFASFGDDITYEVMDNSATVTVGPDNIEGIFDATSYVNVYIMDHEYEILYDEYFEF